MSSGPSVSLGCAYLHSWANDSSLHGVNMDGPITHDLFDQFILLWSEVSYRHAFFSIAGLDATQGHGCIYASTGIHLHCIGGMIGIFIEKLRLLSLKVYLDRDTLRQAIYETELCRYPLRVQSYNPSSARM